jgi:hypothetical protein
MYLFLSTVSKNVSYLNYLKNILVIAFDYSFLFISNRIENNIFGISNFFLRHF